MKLRVKFNTPSEVDLLQGSQRDLRRISEVATVSHQPCNVKGKISDGIKGFFGQYFKSLLHCQTCLFFKKLFISFGRIRLCLAYGFPLFQYVPLAKLTLYQPIRINYKDCTNRVQKTEHLNRERRQRLFCKVFFNCNSNFNLSIFIGS